MSESFRNTNIQKKGWFYNIIIMSLHLRRLKKGLMKHQNSISSFHYIQRRKYVKIPASAQNLEHINKGVDFVALYFSNFKNPYAIDNMGGNWHLLKALNVKIANCWSLVGKKLCLIFYFKLFNWILHLRKKYFPLQSQ